VQQTAGRGEMRREEEKREVGEHMLGSLPLLENWSLCSACGLYNWPGRKLLLFKYL